MLQVGAFTISGFPNAAFPNRHFIWHNFKDGHDSQDPKQSTADMTAFVQNLLQQMQSRFQTMSDSIVTKNILFICPSSP
ncbi:hypothetical protein RIF29_23194 [Crotalaria pallida]|uniref:Uncharacterized protein n=1 Tax=Crotalaria pallida TaxID=3830 RepID=A0AAN9FA42_CROPI